MEVHYEDLPDVEKYIVAHRQGTLEDERSYIESVLGFIGKQKKLDHSSRILEVGVGSGWFQIYCKQQGLDIHGLDISQQMIGLAKETGAKYGLDLDIILGNVETESIGTEKYDVIVACSIFEHVERWRDGVENIYNALKPGGVFYFDSTNKFSFKSGEYDFPLYGWLPNSWRYKLRVARQGEDIMKLGIDFHQFTYPLLRRSFKEIGFSEVLDFVELKDVASLRSSNPLKKLALRSLRTSKPLKHVALSFVPATIFVCVK